MSVYYFSFLHRPILSLLGYFSALTLTSLTILGRHSVIFGVHLKSDIQKTHSAHSITFLWVFSVCAYFQISEVYFLISPPQLLFPHLGWRGGGG